MGELSKFIDLLKQDKNALKAEKMEQEFPTLSHVLKDKFEMDKDELWLDFEIFIRLINEYCYENVPTDYDYIKGYVPKERLELFEKIFLKDYGSFENKFIDWHHQDVIIPSKELLYNRFFYSVYIKSITGSKEISDIVKEEKEIWFRFLSSNKLPLVFEISLEDVFIEDDYIKINDAIQIVKKYDYYYFSRNGMSRNFLNKLGSFLMYRTEINVNSNFFDNPQKFDYFSLEKEWFGQIRKIQQILFSLRLTGINFLYKKHNINYPWWVWDTKKKYKSLGRSLGRWTLKNQLLCSFLHLHKKISDYKLFLDEELALIIYRYFRIFDRESIGDAILDQFIILESIFTRGSKAELTFRLALNIALFLSDSKEETEENFDIIYEIYNIRRDIIHGKPWVAEFKKKKKKKKKKKI